MELTLQWKNHCALSANGTDNNDADPHNIIFTIKDTKLYVPVITLSAKVLNKEFKRSVYWNENENNTANNYRYFLESNLYELKGCFDLIQIIMTVLKGIKLKGII